MSPRTNPPINADPSLTRADLVAAVPDVASALRLRGLGARVNVWRDPEGVPHVRAASARDAFVAQGFVRREPLAGRVSPGGRRA